MWFTFQLAWEHHDILLEELREVTGERGIWASLQSPLPPQLDLNKQMSMSTSSLPVYPCVTTAATVSMFSCFSLQSQQCVH